jgi:hypothetical protein
VKAENKTGTPQQIEAYNSMVKWLSNHAYPEYTAAAGGVISISQ